MQLLLLLPPALKEKPPRSVSGTFARTASRGMRPVRRRVSAALREVLVRAEPRAVRPLLLAVSRVQLGLVTQARAVPSVVVRVVRCWTTDCRVVPE